MSSVPEKSADCARTIGRSSSLSREEGAPHLEEEEEEEEVEEERSKVDMFASSVCCWEHESKKYTQCDACMTTEKKKTKGLDWIV